MIFKFISLLKNCPKLYISDITHFSKFVINTFDSSVIKFEYTLGEINKTNLFHPFKDAILHTLLRNTLKVSKINNKTRKIKNLILC